MVICYPQNGKKKSLDICSAFAQGCGGAVVADGQYRAGMPSMFYGIDVANEEVWKHASNGSGQDYYYADNAFFDQFRGTYFRVGKNRLQHDGFGVSDGSRFKKLGLKLHPWRVTGQHILLCPQSDHFMRVAVGYPGAAMGWLRDTMSELRKYTNRELRVRLWDRDKRKLAAELPDALRGAWALVTYSSGSAISAILSGVPAISTADCIARRMCGDLSTIENPLMPERQDWANIVADQQWTLDEFRDGTAWRMLQ